MTTPSGEPDPKSSETDPPAANQPLGEPGDSDTHERDASDTTPAGEPAPTPVPVKAAAGGQIPVGRPDGEVDTSA